MGRLRRAGARQGTKGRRSAARRPRAVRSPGRILIVDDQRTSRGALRAALARRRDLTVVGESPTGEASAEAARVSQADVAVVNVTVEPERVAACVAPLLRAHPRLRVLVVSLPDPAALGASALAAGAAHCFVRKTAAQPDKQAVLRAVERLAAAPPPTVLRAAAGAASPPRAVPLLSRREQQVLELLARGHTRREIAEQLGIGVKSIETYRSRLAHKLGAHTRAELVRYALVSGLLRPSA